LLIQNLEKTVLKATWFAQIIDSRPLDSARTSRKLGSSSIGSPRTWRKFCSRPLGSARTLRKRGSRLLGSPRTFKTWLEATWLSQDFENTWFETT
jgi:hypothetical protein